MSDLENFTFVEEESAPIIKVIGVGGGGSNAVNNMWNKGIKDVQFAICNTDQQALKSSPVPEKISIGILGAGGDPKVAAAKARDHVEEIKKSCSGNTRMVFLAACMGGGTGTGASPVIAEAIKEIKTSYEDTKDILIVAIVTKPFLWEGNKRVNNAKAGIAELKKYADSVIVINNEKLRSLGNKPLPELFKLADEILLTATRSIAELITNNQYVNIDFQDVYSIMSGSKTALMGCGIGEGENRAEMAITAAANSVLLDDQDIHNAKGCLLNVTSSSEHAITMDEFDFITSYVNREILDADDPDSNVIWGTGYDDSLGDKLQVTLVATGFNRVEGDTFVKPAKVETKEEPKQEKQVEVIPLVDTPIAEEPKQSVISEPVAPQVNAETTQPADDVPPFVIVKKEEPAPEPKEEKGEDSHRIVIDIDSDNVSLEKCEPENKAKENIETEIDDIRVITDTRQENTAPVATAPKIDIEQLGISDSPKPAEPKAVESENVFDSRMRRARELKELLKSGLSGITHVANMDLVHGDTYQSSHSSVSDVSNSMLSSDGILNNNPLLYSNPD